MKGKTCVFVPDPLVKPDEDDKMMYNIVDGPVWVDHCEHYKEKNTDYLCSFETVEYNKQTKLTHRATWDAYLIRDSDLWKSDCFCFRSSSEPSDYRSTMDINTILKSEVTRQHEPYLSLLKILEQFGYIESRWKVRE